MGAVSPQAYKDSGSGAVAVGHNVRITKFSCDPQQPDQTVGCLSQLPCADADSTVGFIGDYCGLAVSAGNIYALTVSTHYPSDVPPTAAARCTTSNRCSPIAPAIRPPTSWARPRVGDTESAVRILKDSGSTVPRSDLGL